MAIAVQREINVTRRHSRWVIATVGPGFIPSDWWQRAVMSHTQQPDSETRRRRYQYRLRSLLLLVTVIAACLSLVYSLPVAVLLWLVVYAAAFWAFNND